MKHSRTKQKAIPQVPANRLWYPYLWLTLAALAPYVQTLWYGFSPLDDTWLLVEKFNYISDIRNLRDFFINPFLGETIGYYRPLRSIFFMFDSIIGGGDPFVYHLTNTLLHLVNVFMLFNVLKKFRIQAATALVLALFFAVHPMHVFNVAWIPGRVDTLMTFFTLASIICLMQFTLRRKPAWLALHFVLFACALLTKESTIVIPVIGFLYLLLFSEKVSRKEIFLFTGIWIILIAGWYYLRSTAVNDMAKVNSIDLAAAFSNSAKAVLITFGKLVVPIYPSGTASLIGGGFFIVLLWILLRFVGMNDKRTVLLGGAWYILFLIVPAVFKKGYFEWWSYPANIGALLMISQIRIKIRSRYWLWIPAALIVCSYAGVTMTKNRLFRDEVTFANYYLDHITSEPSAYYIRGSAYMKQSRFQEAISDFDRVLERRPNYTNAYFSRGLCYTNLKDYAPAIADFSQMIEIDTAAVIAYYHRGFCYFFQRDYGRAKADFEYYLSKMPNNGAAFFYLGVCEFHSGNFDHTIGCYTKARELGFSVPDALFDEVNRAREQSVSD
jgi:hypothetical protein